MLRQTTVRRLQRSVTWKSRGDIEAYYKAPLRYCIHKHTRTHTQIYRYICSLIQSLVFYLVFAEACLSTGTLSLSFIVNFLSKCPSSHYTILTVSSIRHPHNLFPIMAALGCTLQPLSAYLLCKGSQRY